jgi:DNA-directed RNA polymerase subunit M/transcription elongation factor TFIIS
MSEVNELNTNLNELNKQNEQNANLTELILEAKLDNADALPISFYNKNFHVLRQAKVSMFTSFLKKHDSITSKEMRLDLASKLEKSCYLYTVNKSINENIPNRWDNDLFIIIYNSTCARISSNLSTTNLVKNNYLLPNILNGNINIEILPSLSSQELFPDMYLDIINKLEISKTVQSTVKTSSMYRCRRCGKKECTIANRYNRSLDEGVNLTITCVSCGYEWNG